MPLKQLTFSNSNVNNGTDFMQRYVPERLLLREEVWPCVRPHCCERLHWHLHLALQHGSNTCQQDTTQLSAVNSHNSSRNTLSDLHSNWLVHHWNYNKSSNVAPGSTLPCTVLVHTKCICFRIQIHQVDHSLNKRSFWRLTVLMYYTLFFTSLKSLLN